MLGRASLFCVLLAGAASAALSRDATVTRTETLRQRDGAAFVAYYWRARPGRVDDYNEYIRRVAEPIDEDARKAGVFEEVRTVTPVEDPGATRPDWTHLRIFRVRNMAAVAQLGAGLDAATLRVVPDEAERKANSARSATLRDLVRREVWTELR